MPEAQDYNKLSWKQRKELREAYIEAQGGKCHHCGTPLSGPPNLIIQRTHVKESLFPPGFFTRPVHLHHNHRNGMTIGAVHCKCNAVLWQYHGE